MKKLTLLSIATIMCLTNTYAREIKLQSETWEVPSKEKALINIAHIGPQSITSINKNLTLVCLNANSSATDFSAYFPLYLIFDNNSEMPQHQAVFPLGQVGTVESAKMINDNTLEIITLLHEKSHRYSKLISMKKRLTIDLTKLQKMLKTRPIKEGNLDVSAEVTVSEILNKK